MFRAPAPVKKAAFLKCHRRRELGRWELAAVQAGHIRWWVWALSLGVFGAVLWAAAWPYPAMGLSLSFDHRAVDGAPAARFMQELCKNLEQFTALLAK